MPESARGLFVVNEQLEVAVILFGGGVRAEPVVHEFPFSKVPMGFPGLGIDLIHGRRPLGDLGGPLCFGSASSLMVVGVATGEIRSDPAALKRGKPGGGADWARVEGGRRKKGDGGCRRESGEMTAGDQGVHDVEKSSRRLRRGSMRHCGNGVRFAVCSGGTGSAAAELPL